MILLFLLLNFLAGVNVCVAFDPSVGQPKNYGDDRLVSHSIRQGVSSSNETMSVDGEAKHGKSNSAEEDRNLMNRIAAKVSAFLEPSSVKDYKIAHDELERHFATMRDERELVKSIITKLKDHPNMGPSVVKMLVKLQEDTNLKPHADATVLLLLSKPETVQLVVDSWLASVKTPEEIFAFLFQQIHVGESDLRSPWMQFVESGLFHLWLTYVNAYWTKIELTHEEKSFLKEFVNQLFVYGGKTEDLELTLKRAKQTQDGTDVFDHVLI